MTKIQIYTIAALLLIIILFALYYYVFNIYEVNYSVTPKNLFADNQSMVTINVIPINALGFKTPLRTAPAEFQITQGEELILIIMQDNKKGKLILKAKGETGMVIVKIKSKYSLLPSSVSIPVYPNYAFGKI